MARAQFAGSASMCLKLSRKSEQAMGNYYNGYSWTQRAEILKAERRLRKSGDLEALAYYAGPHPCDICGDPDRRQWHSEDYSKPFIFRPPATFAICGCCHLRLHGRFAAPAMWVTFLAHVRSGGYGREFTSLYGKRQRDDWARRCGEGAAPVLPSIRPRPLAGDEWWQRLTLNPEALKAAWARPRPLRPRPDAASYRAAVKAISTPAAVALLTFHAMQPNRATTMRRLAAEVLGTDVPSSAERQYVTLANKLCHGLPWEPDRAVDGSLAWMSVIAEGWMPEGREVEWVMVPALVAACRGLLDPADAATPAHWRR